MHSHLRNQVAFEPISAHTTAASFPHSIESRPEKRQRMGIASTYRLAHRARGKLSSEAGRGDHDLRLLVGHANLLDSLMIELQDAERDQQAWFNQSITVNTPEEPKRVQWSDSMIEEHQLDVPDASDDEEEEEEEEADSESELESVIASATQPIAIPRTQQSQQQRRRARSPPAPTVRHTYADEESDEDEDMESDDEYDNASLTLVRTRSHSGTAMDMPVPELVQDNSDESDDESAPSSPEAMDLDSHHVIVKDFAAIAAAPIQKQTPRQRQKMLDEALDAIMEVDDEDSFIQAPQHSAPVVAAY